MTDPDLAPLRGRADFAALVWDIAESGGQPAVGRKLKLNRRRRNETQFPPIDAEKTSAIIGGICV